MGFERFEGLELAAQGQIEVAVSGQDLAELVEGWAGGEEADEAPGEVAVAGETGLGGEEGREAVGREAPEEEGEAIGDEGPKFGVAVWNDGAELVG